MYRFPQDGILLDAGIGLEIGGNRTPRSIWIFPVHVSNALGTISLFRFDPLQTSRFSLRDSRTYCPCAMA